MKCLKHPDKDAVAQCADCGAGVCGECAERTKLLTQDYGCSVSCMLQIAPFSDRTGVQSISGKEKKVCNHCLYIVRDRYCDSRYRVVSQQRFGQSIVLSGRRGVLRIIYGDRSLACKQRKQCGSAPRQ